MRRRMQDAEEIQQFIFGVADSIGTGGFTHKELQWAVCSPLEKWVDGKANRRLVIEYVFGVTSTNSLSVTQLAALYVWMGLEFAPGKGMNKGKHVETFDSANAKAEAQILLTAAMRMKGQMDLWQTPDYQP